MSLPPPPSDDDATVDPLLNPDAPAISVPDSNDSSEGGKLKMILQLVKRSLGVKDIAAMRISLPASLMEPIPNLEYWQYLDRPDLFAAINDSTDAFERMLAVLRFTLSKDLKFVHGKVVKPYNSVLGEHFRCHWSIKPVSYPSDPNAPPILHSHLTAPLPSAPPSEAASTRSSTRKTAKSPRLGGLRPGSMIGGSGAGSTSTLGTPTATGSAGTGDLQAALAADVSKLSLTARSMDSDSITDSLRVVFLTEQVSHHPPISSFYCGVPEKGIEAVGVDQISAKVSATGSLRVSPGESNKGIFISLTSGPGQGEKYQITHPVAIVGGLLRGNPYATITETTIVTCSGEGGQRLRAIIEYKEESWLGKSQFLIEGIIHTYDASDEDGSWTEWTKIKHVPKENVVATFDGCWQKRVYWKRAGESSKNLLIDLSSMLPVPKQVRPVADQTQFESRKLWASVTDNLLTKNYSEATKQKQSIEQAQRDRAAERKKKGTEFVPVYFERGIESGEPRLTEEGRRAVEEEAKLSV